MILSAPILNGKADFHPKDKEDLQRYLFSKEGKTIWFTIGDKRPERTLSQNSYYHGVVVKMISTYTGDDPESTHADLKEMFCPRFFTEDGKPIAKSTTRLNTKEMKEYIDRIVAWAATEYSIAIPSPNEHE